MKRSALTAYRFARSTDIDSNARTFQRRAQTFSAAALGARKKFSLLRKPDPPIALIAHHDEAGAMNTYLVCGQIRNPQAAAKHLADAVGATAHETEVPDVIYDTPDMAYLACDLHGMAGRESLNDVDPAEFSRLLSGAIPPGCWAGVLMRRPTRSDVSRWSLWFSHRMGGMAASHHSMQPETVVASIIGGSPVRGMAQQFLPQVATSMPGFDQPVRSRSISRLRAAEYPLGVWGVLSLLMVVEWVLRPRLLDGLGKFIHSAALAPTLFATIPHVLLALWIPVTLLLILSLLYLVPWWPAPLHSRRIVRPPFRLSRPKRPSKEMVQRNAEGLIDTITPETTGAYPLDDASFMMGPEVFCGIVAPQAGAMSGETSSRLRAVPPALLQPMGASFGTVSGTPVFFSALDTRFGIAVTGAPGSGKSRLLEAIYGWNCLERVKPSGLEGAPGRNNTLIVFDSKGGESRNYKQWSDAAGDQAYVFSVNDPSTPSIDFFATPGTYMQRAAAFVSAIEYAFGADAVQFSSQEKLTAVFAVALCCTPELVKTVEGVDANRSVMHYANILIGATNLEQQEALYGAVRSSALQKTSKNPDDADARAMYEAAEAMSSIMEMSRSTRLRELSAPRNKIAKLYQLDHWWNPNRPKASFAEILEKHYNVIIDFGVHQDMMVDDSLERTMTALTMHVLRSQIRRTCDNWFDTGRSVTLFAPELTDVAGTSPEVVTWFREKGRSFGIRLCFATQRAEQLSREVQQSFLTYIVLMSFVQGEKTVADAVATQLGGDWTGDEVMNLNVYHVAVRAHYQGALTPSFTMLIPNFHDAKKEWLEWWASIPQQRASGRMIPPPISSGSTGGTPAVQQPSWASVTPEQQSSSAPSWGDVLPPAGATQVEQPQRSSWDQVLPPAQPQQQPVVPRPASGPVVDPRFSSRPTHRPVQPPQPPQQQG